ncbi:MRN complex-interacting protein [Drosophila teissieri]|uniref:MRN complex-interacting protein n=1 Tax=Drosophila teissieri TaxID=7243 RepID=UPI001CB9FA3D|nr:MRN complex-interacting protein [Drosophila teissieri]
MSQQIRVVQCIQCKMYQVDFVKKANTWQCKICRENQNLLKEFFRGSAAECRVKVQHLNLERGMQEDKLNALFLTAKQQLEAEKDCLDNEENTTPQKNANKWANYVDKPLVPTQKSTAEPRITEELSGEISMDFKKTRRTEPRSFKRSAENMPSANKKSCSKWSDFL